MLWRPDGAVPDRSGALPRLCLRDLRLRDATVIANTFLLLLAIQPTIRLAGLGLTARWAALLVGRSSNLSLLALKDLEIERTARLIRGCCRRWPFRTTCLDRSFVSLVLLSRRGVPVTLFVGFSRNDEGVEGHAWVEFDERPLAEPIDVRERYSRQALLHSDPVGGIAMNNKPAAPPSSVGPSNVERNA